MNIIPAKYTEVLVNLLNNTEAKAKIDQAMSTYPLYERKDIEREFIPCYIPTRQELNNKILNYYKYREIGQETFGRFLFELETALIEIMPYYNQLYFSTDQDFNITYNVDYRRTIDRTKEENSSSTSETETNTTAQDETETESHVTGYSKTLSADTPQSSLNSYTASQIDSVDYASNITWNNNLSNDTASTSGESSTSGTSNVSNEGTGTETEGTVETTKGNFGVVSAQDLILKYRQTILNIDQQIINDPRIQELFMLVY